MKNIVIVGGGTAGWITALYAKKNLPSYNIVLIESEDIGILGAGEGVATNFVDFINHVEINPADLISRAGATLKSGIKFTNWSTDKKFFYHGFGSHHQDLGMFSAPNINQSGFFSSQYFFPNAENTEDELYIEESEKNKVMFAKNNFSESSDSFKAFKQYYRYSFHFDARKMAAFLSETGVNRGISLIKGDVVSFLSSHNKDISHINLSDGRSIPADFVFDCTGFARLIIGKHFNSKWISFKDKLPMKKAIPFVIPIDKNNIPPYTEAIAMDYGWMWKIPLQNRYGCGYVFDSDYISEPDAIKEIENFLGFEPEYPRKNKGSFSFNPGCFKNVLVGNVLGVGLASGFVEPLEATSIAQTIVLLQRFFTNPALMFIKDEENTKHFNQKYVDDSEFIADFIQMHYMTKKTNTDFWINFINKNNISKTLIHRINLMKNSMVTDQELFRLHSAYSYYAIANGIDLLDKEKTNKYIDTLGFKKLKNIINDEKQYYINTDEKFLYHHDILKMLGGFSE